MLDDEWISEGTHISAMGADSRGKQELPIALVQRAKLFCDIAEQSITIGEFQTARAEGLSLSIAAIGSVIIGSESGRSSDSEITIFDSSGTAVQDLAICNAALKVGQQRNQVQLLAN